jgi:hypothetical protein
MKTLLAIAGTACLFTAPALAGNAKKLSAKPHTVASVDKVAKTAKADKVAAATPAASEVAVPADAELALPSLASSVLVALPDLPEDTQTPFAVPASIAAALVASEAAAATRAAPAKPAKAQKAPALNFGADYVLGGREASSAPTTGADVEKIVLKSLSQAQVASVVQSHMDEIQVCWNMLPKSQRADACTADLRLSISETGAVTDIEIVGPVPATAHKCITSAVSRWSFPAAEIASDVEYGISMRSL